MMSFFAVELRRATDVAIVTVSNPALHGHICSVLLDRREGGYSESCQRALFLMKTEHVGGASPTSLKQGASATYTNRA